MAAIDETSAIEMRHLQTLFKVLIDSGYIPVGPTIRDGAIVYDELHSVDDLPAGWTEEQDAGNYRLKKRPDAAFFGFNNGPHSWKKYLFPPNSKLWQAKKNKDGGFSFVEDQGGQKPFAFIGVRACDLHAIEVQDRVFIKQQHPDPLYAARRGEALIIAVNCGQAAKTCFCTSMSTGPRVTAGYDLSLTEILNSDEHYFLVEPGTEKGLDLLRNIPHEAASNEQIAAAEVCEENAANQIERKIDTSDIKALLYRNYENQRWDALEQRCLACGNCTMACPTCFCSKVDDVTDLSGEHAERWRQWESCFTMDFSYIHGGSVRTSTRSRYRQWLMHKLATWLDQFGSSGCVGCGRCITWCPVGIDLTEEVRLIRESDNHTGTDSV